MVRVEYWEASVDEFTLGCASEHVANLVRERLHLVRGEPVLIPDDVVVSGPSRSLQPSMRLINSSESRSAAQRDALFTWRKKSKS